MVGIRDRGQPYPEARSTTPLYQGTVQDSQGYRGISEVGKPQLAGQEEFLLCQFFKICKSSAIRHAFFFSFSFCDAKDRSQGLVRAGQALCPASSILSPRTPFKRGSVHTVIINSLLYILLFLMVG